MNTTASEKPLTVSVLRRLTNEALVTFLGEAAQFEAVGAPGLQVALCNEPVADMNLIVVGAGAGAERFSREARACLDRELPFLVLVFPDADASLNETASTLGLVYAADFPIMVREDLPMEPQGNPDVAVSRGAGVDDAEANAAVVASAFKMPGDAALRAMPPSLVESPGIDVYLARLGGESVGAVTLTHHGETCGIWAMATHGERQRGGIGRRLLSTAISRARGDGARRFFLGATPAGYRLYEALGFTTRFDAKVWVYGETHQA